MQKKHCTASFASPYDGRSELAVALRVLDQVLAAAVEKQAKVLGPASLLDPWRGMHLDRNDVDRLLERTPLSGTWEPGDGLAEFLGHALLQVPRLAALRTDDFDVVDFAILLILLAPDIDLRYEKIYGYLQDDISRRRPTTDLIANLLARDMQERLAVCARLQANSALARFAMLTLIGNSDTPPLARAWRIDDVWRNWMLGQSDLPAQLSDHVRLLMPGGFGLDGAIVESSVRERLRRIVDANVQHSTPLRLLLWGPPGSGKFALAKALASETRARILIVDLREMTRTSELRTCMLKAQRAAILYNAVLYLHGLHKLEQQDAQLLRALFDGLGSSGCAYILSCVEPLPTLHCASGGLHRIALDYPSRELRHQTWGRALAERSIELPERDTQKIAARFSLSSAQIEQAAAEAHAEATVERECVDYLRIVNAVRRQCGTELSRIAQRVIPRARFSSLVLPAELQAVLQEICVRVTSRDALGGDWAESSVHARAVGVTALFAGPSGTGKTLAAEAVARELDLDFYKIDLAGVVSKYVGETEKNLDRVFNAATHANAVLFFDEADALFGKRSEVKDAMDRYANIEVAYLLQKMEQFDGLAILATNLKQNLDEAFARRLTFTLNFPFPEENERRQLWERLWPAHIAREADIDFGSLAREFKLSGGNIRNAVLAAAHAAAAADQVVTREHLLQAIRREYQKLGKNLLMPVMPERVAV